jgi:NADPH-dependent glutamate synthase beta subunit-like oxidoreductase
MTDPLAPRVLTRGATAEPGSSLDFKTGDWRTLKPVHVHGAAPCHTACPAGEDAQAWIAGLQEDRLQQAWEAIARVNPLPGVTGRVCPHPCEGGCNRGGYDAALNIHGLERWLGDRAVANGWPFPPSPEPAVAGRSVAVVGAGPAGLSCAYHLRRRGHAVTLFDALPEPGGLLRTALPLNRLPREVLDAEIGRILDLGIAFRGHCRIGDPGQPDLAALRADFDAVFLAPGCGLGRQWTVAEGVPDHPRTALDLLKEWIAVGALPTPRAVAIHGGGNTAVDLARVLKRAGVAEVHVITASGLPGPDADPADVLNVVPREYDQAVEEGIVFHPHRTVGRLLQRGSKLMGCEIVALRKLPRGDGRQGRVAFEGTETILHVDMVVPAIGEIVDPHGWDSLLGAGNSHFQPCDRWGRLAGAEDVFVGGDARGTSTGAGGTMAAAIGDGRRAAEAMDAWFRSGDPNATATATATAIAIERPPIAFDGLNTAYYEPAPRQDEPVLPAAERTDTAEISGPLDDAAVLREAARCFSCGNCLACDNCWTLCPDAAVIKTRDVASDGSHYVFDLDYCKGCGLCAHECPCGYIAMEEDH